LAAFVLLNKPISLRTGSDPLPTQAAVNIKLYVSSVDGIRCVESEYGL
jgi:hypothetical protein